MKVEKPVIKAKYHDEPALEFGGGREHVCQKTGITIFGPKSIEEKIHPQVIKIGFIGSGHSIDAAKSWIDRCISGVSGVGEHTDFPGFSEDRGFYCKLQFDEMWDQIITQSNIRNLLKERYKKDRFRILVESISDKLRIISQKDNAPDYVILALPDDVLQSCKVIDYMDKDLGKVHRDLRRALKAESMRYRIPTQILLQRTTEATAESRNVDHLSKCAWNFFSSLYYKVGGIPWSPIGLDPGSCFVGISFHKTLGSKNGNYFTSIAQAFDEHGNGLVLRGQDFVWDDTQHGKSPHLTNELINDLINKVLKRYRDELKQIPTRVIIHKTSKYWPEEREGIEHALSEINQYDLFAVSPNTRVRLLRDGQYPILRGTQFSVGNEHYLYTTGYISALKSYPHGHIPVPLKVYDHIGDSSINQLLNEVLVLSKMNWNTAIFAGLMPITLRFSKLVGEIIREIPDDVDPLPQFKYYM